MGEKEKGELIKNALKLVDKLANMDINDDLDDIEELIEQAIKLKKNKFWKLN